MLRWVSFLLSILIVASCALAPEDKMVLRQVRFENLPGWEQENFAQLMPALQKSVAKKCEWGMLCQQIASFDSQDPAKIRTFLEQHFTPFQASNRGEEEGLFTGYYVPRLQGSRTKSARYHVPLYPVPDELVTIDLASFGPDYPQKKLVGWLDGKKVRVFYDRADIDRGALAHVTPVVWVDDPVAAFFLHIQGSGLVEFENGEVIRVGYAGKNGREYVAIGRELVARGALELEDVSLQSIRAWLDAHPQEAEEILHANPSYVFFRPLKESGVVGAQNVVLTPERSMAVDPKFVPYGTLLWVDIAHPAHDGRLQKLMVAQDTGGAITGPVRGDYFWGAGEKAADMAGRMKSRGQYYLLLPNIIDQQMVKK